MLRPMATMMVTPIALAGRFPPRSPLGTFGHLNAFRDEVSSGFVQMSNAHPYLLGWEALPDRTRRSSNILGDRNDNSDLAIAIVPSPCEIFEKLLAPRGTIAGIVSWACRGSIHAHFFFEAVLPECHRDNSAIWTAA